MHHIGTGRVDLNRNALGVEHRADDTRNRWPVKPVERRCERHNPKSAQRSGKVLSAHLHPLRIDDASIFGQSLRFDEHVAISIETDDLVKEVCEAKCDYAWATPDVEQPAVIVERKLRTQYLSEPFPRTGGAPARSTTRHRRTASRPTPSPASHRPSS